MKKVGILGGTFNPPHIGHCIIANEVLHALSLDEVRLMPNAIPPHKQLQHGVSDAERKEMVRIAIESEQALKLETYELEQGGVSYSYDTMKALCAKEPDVKFYFIIGGDSVASLHTWYKIEELVRLVQFVGVKRPGFEATSKYDVVMIDIPEINLSSSLIRERLKSNSTVRYLVPGSVEGFIRKEGLYGSRA